MQTSRFRRTLMAALIGTVLMAMVGAPPAGAAFSGTNGVIAYTKWVSGDDEEIYTMKSDGTARTQLTDNAVDDESPSFNKAGTAIVFFRNNPDSEIYVMSSTGGVATRLTDNDVEDRDPSWSADGSKIYFSRRLGDWEIFSMNADGSNVVQLTDNANSDREAVENNAGTTVAYEHVNTSGHWDLWTMTPSGTSNHILIDCVGIRECMSPDWSPQGDRITYTRWNWTNPDHAYSVVYIANADGTGRQQLTVEGGYNNYSVFSPDGAFVLWGGVDIFRYNLATGVVSQLTNTPNPEEWGPDWQATA